METILTQVDSKKLSRTFDAFTKQSKKRLLQKEQRKHLEGWDKDCKTPTPVLSGNAYDKLREIMLYPKTIKEEQFFDVSNLVMMAWYRQIKSKRKATDKHG